MLLQSTDRDELRTEREIRREPSSPPRSYKQHRSSLSSGSVESRMAELDDIQRSMEVEETEEEELDTARIKREPYDTDSDSVSSGREGGTYPHHGARVQCQQPPSPVEPYINNNVSGMDSRIATHEWTFEEQFKQLYELGAEAERKEFLDDLFTFMQKRGTPVNRVPIMAKQTLDLFKLFRLVVEKGGLVEIIKGLSLPASVTSAAFTLRTQYMKYLYPYECAKKKLSTPAELQAAIDGNRRDSRRSFGSFLSQAMPSETTHAYSSPSPTTTPPAFTASSPPGISNRSSPGSGPGPSTSNHDVHVPPSVHGNNGVALLHSPGVVQFSPKRSSSATEVASRGVSSSPSDVSPCGSPVKKFAAASSNERNSVSQSGHFQFPDSDRSSQSREQRQLPLTLLDQVSDNSLLVSVELNGVVYQGVLFARPSNRPDSRKSNEDY
ncbi:Protein dead ringer-like protein [Acropora cervicornis]|uniref:Protein dead ringer-like protein n=1 Tax=Acropora cervicornis TaxID=6130 RepID=A0AAD9Q531_ACRCE|nr:Protein dead ringer-like protein [Acropora cervicornis]